MQLLLFTLLLFQSQILQTELFRHYDTEKGLSNNIVYDIFQDSNGFIWIATENGLNRFDGYKFKKYFSDDQDIHSLSSNIIRSIIEDKDGNIWVGTFNGLNLLDNKSGTFTRFIEIQFGKSNRLDLQQMIYDKKGRIWFCTLETMGWFDIEKKEFHYLSQIENPFSISLDGEGFLWVQSFEGDLFRYEIEQDKLTKVSANQSASQTPIFWGNYSGIFWSASKLNIPKLIETSATIPELPQRRLPLKLIEQSKEKLMIASDGGLYSFSINKKELVKIDFSEKSSSLTNSIRSLFQDRNGGLWVGTLNGFFHFDPYQKPFSHID